MEKWEKYDVTDKGNSWIVSIKNQATVVEWKIAKELCPTLEELHKYVIREGIYDGGK